MCRVNRPAAAAAGVAGLLVCLSPAGLSQYSVAHNGSLAGPGAGSGAVRDAGSQPRRALKDSAAAAAAAATAPVTGTFVAGFAIKLATAIPTGGTLTCTLSASTYDENPNSFDVDNYILDSMTATATVSGSTASCTATLPYSWYLLYGSTDTVALTYDLTILPPTSASQAGPVRHSTQYLPGAASIQVPANGSTTKYSISATL